MKEVYIISGATLYYEDGRRKNIHFTAVTKDLEKLRGAVREKHGAQVVRLLYENKI